MTQKIAGSTTTSYTYDAENRMTAVSGAATATFVYDGDGNRVKGVVGGVTTTYIGNYFEWSPSGKTTLRVQAGSTSTMKKYYYAGGTRVAERVGTLSTSYYFLLTDHLGSTSITATRTGGFSSELRYKAWGETRYSSGSTPTTFRYTGQREESSLGLYWYNSRWYSPGLGRFVSPDTIIPQPGIPMAWDRYSYVNSNPVRYVDPSGHMAWAGEGGDDRPFALTRLYKQRMSEKYNWSFSDDWTLKEVKEVRQAAQDIETYIGTFGGNGQQWISAYLGGVTFAKEQSVMYPIRALDGGNTYLELSLNDALNAIAFVFPSNRITFQNSYTFTREDVVHELGHTLDNWLGGSSLFEAAIFGGGWADAQIQFLGGQTYGLRCAAPHNLKDWALPQGDYGNQHQADFFAQHFRYQVYGYPENYDSGMAGMWMDAFVNVTVNMLP